MEQKRYVCEICHNVFPHYEMSYKSSMRICLGCYANVYWLYVIELNNTPKILFKDFFYHHMEKLKCIST